MSTGRRPPGGPSSPTVTLLAWLAANKQQVLTGVGAAAAAYMAYKAYNSESAAKLAKLRNAVGNYSSAIGSVSASAALIAGDLQAFLSSDQDELPRSLKQLNKLFQSQDVQESIVTAATSVARGVSHATASTSGASEGSSPVGAAMLDKVLEAMLSDRGRSLVGMAVGLATKNATSTLCEFLERMQRGAGAPHVVHADGEHEGEVPAGPSVMHAVVSLLASDQGERVLSLLITKSIKTAVSTYVDATIGYNFYDDMLASVSKQEHRDAVTDIMSRVTAAFCREVAVAYKKSRSPANTSANTPTSSSSSSSLLSYALNAHRPGADASAGGAGPSGSHGGDSTVVIGHMSRRLSGDTLSMGPAPPPRPASAGGIAISAGMGRAVNGALQQALHHKANTPKPPPPVWLRQVVDLAREQDVRSLALDVVKSATREATRSTIETLMYSGEGGGTRLAGMLQLSTYRLYMLLTVCVSLAMYALTPRTLVL